MREAMSRRRMLAYALGNAGFQVTDRIVVLVAIYFYLPPAESDLVPLLSQEIVLGVLTAWGLARLLGGLVDSLADPLVGWGSDRSRSPLGRRRSYLVYGIAPMVALPVLLFWPPGEPGSATVFAFLTLVLALYYVAFTVYVGPYLALIPELAPGAAERTRLATLLAASAMPVTGGFAAAWLAGVALGRHLGLDTAGAVRAVVLFSSLLALLLCAAPILAVDERRFADSRPSGLALGPALRETLRRRPFVVYLGAQILFIVGVTMLQPALPYLSVVALGRSEAWGAWLGLSYLPGVVVGFFLLARSVERVGPKRSMLASLVFFAACAGALGLLRPDLPGGPEDARNLALAFGALGLAGLPIASFLVLPHVLIGQLIDADSVRTGAGRAAMYFGVQGLLTKWVYAASLALLSYLFARYGNSRADPDGVLLIGPVAGACFLASAGVYALYPERRVLAESTERREGRREAAAPVS